MKPSYAFAPGMVASFALGALAPLTLIVICILAIVAYAPDGANGACYYARGRNLPSGSVTTRTPAIRSACYLAVSAKNPILEPVPSDMTDL